jgi:hypothetical protein
MRLVHPGLRDGLRRPERVHPLQQRLLLRQRRLDLLGVPERFLRNRHRQHGLQHVRQGHVQRGRRGQLH